MTMYQNVQKVQNVQFTPTEQFRWDNWKRLRNAGFTDLEIALKFQLKSEKQIQRLKRKAKQNGAYREWLSEFLNDVHEEFWSLHKIVKVKNPERAYEQIGRIIERELAQKQEVSIDEKLTEVKVLIIDNSRNPVQDAPEATGNLP